MPLRAIKNRSLPDQVFEQLGREILAGRYEPGASLAAERTLAQVFGVNRHVVREALKRLEQLGLVKVSQGGGTKVLDFERHAGVDLLVLMAEYARGSETEVAHWLYVLEMRACVAADAARLCAIRGGQDVKEELVAIASQMRQTSSTRELARLDARFWECVIDGAGNIAYRLALNTLRRGLRAVRDQAGKRTMSELRRSDYRMPIAMAIASGDAETAEAQTRDVMRASTETFAQRMRQNTDGKRSSG